MINENRPREQEGEAEGLHHIHPFLIHMDVLPLWPLPWPSLGHQAFRCDPLM